MTSKVKQGSSFGCIPKLPSPNPHYNLIFGSMTLLQGLSAGRQRQYRSSISHCASRRGQTFNVQWKILGWKAHGFDWTTSVWAIWITATFNIFFLLHWTLLSSLSYNPASVRGPRFGFMSSSAHQAHIALSEPMTSIARQGSSLGSCPTFLSPKPHCLF